MKIIQIMTVMLLLFIGIMLMEIRVGMEKWGEEITVNKVTRVEHKYHYDVQSFGPIKLNDKLVDFIIE